MTSLSIRNLHKVYGDRIALDDVTFDVREGEIFGFVGSNGAGKTTTMRAVLGVIDLESGEVLVNGRPISVDDRRTIGYMPEERGLYPKMKVAEHLTYLAQLHGFSAHEASRAADAWTDRLGIAERRGDTVESLSLGNQQRVQLAAALVHSPSMLVLDEPFSGLDPVAVNVMSEVLREAADRGTPVVFSSHQLDLVQRISDRVGIIRAGRMEAIGAVEELRADSPIRFRITASGLMPGWSGRLHEVTEEHTDATGATVELDRAIAGPATESALLRLALQTADVTEFTRIRPDLTDLYREMVTS